jgi:hypothetical protein
VLQILDLPLEHRKVRHVGEGLLEEASGVDDYCGLLLEEVVEAPLAGDETSFYSVSQDLSEAAGLAPWGRSILAVDRTPPFSLLLPV